MQYNNTKKHTIRIVVISLLAILLLSSIMAIASSDQSPSPLLGQSGNPSLIQEELGIVIKEKGGIATKDLQLMVTVPDVVHNVKMLPPQGIMVLRTNENIADQIPKKSILGFSSGPSLGASGFHHSTLSFPAKTAGTYLFELYDEEGALLSTERYDVRAIGDASIALQSGSFFNLRGVDISAEVSYTPTLTGQKEKLLVIIPPFFTLTSAVPPSTAQYTVKKVTVPLPVEFYPEPGAQILKDYLGSTPSSEALEVIFEAHVDQAFSFTFAFKSANVANISNLMVLYGQDADKIPIKLVANGTSVDGTIKVSSDVASGIAAITSATDPTPIEGSKVEFPSVVGIKDFSNNNYDYAIPHLNTPNKSVRAIQASNWHYPVTKMRMYIPYSEIFTRHGYSDSNTQIITLDGKRYIQYTWNTNLPEFTDISAYGFHNTAFSYDFPSMDELTPGMIIPMGDVFYDYTYMGQEYAKNKAFTVADLIMPDYKPNTNWSISYQNPNNAGDYNSIYSNREQGKTGDIYRLIYHNSSPTMLSPSFENAVLSMEFPYETSPTSVMYTLGHNNVGARKIRPPQSLEFFVHDDPVPRTVPLPQMPNVGDNVSFTLPIAAGEHVTKLNFQFDLLPSTSRYEFYVTANNARQDENGVDLPNSIDRTLNFTISGTRVEGRLTNNPVRTTISEGVSSNYKLIYTPPVKPPETDKKDSLYFGRASVNPYEQQLNITTATPINVQIGSIFFAFKKTTKDMIDYDNVVVTLDGVTEADRAAISLMSGIGLKYMLPGKSATKNEVYYKTNLRDEWQKSPFTTSSDRTVHLFDLAENEHTTAVKVEFGKILGDGLLHQEPNINDNMIKGTVGVIASGATHSGIFPFFRTNREVFKGDAAKERRILETDRFDIKATITLDGPAQHIINDANASSVFLNDTGKAGINFWLYNNSGVSRNAFTNYGYDQGQSHYQGQSFTMHHHTDGSGPTYNGTHFRFYYEVYDYLEMEELVFGSNAKATLISTKKLPSRGTTLYVYDVITGGKAYYVRGKYYVRPDAPEGPLPILKASGVALVNFKKDYMTPDSGYDAYYNYTPYEKYSIVNERPFPVEWGIDLGVDGQYVMIGGDRGAITVQRATLNLISMIPKVAGAKAENPAPFQDHQKSSMVMDAYMGNGTSSALPYYEALYTIPKAGTTTATPDEQGGITLLQNEFDVYLKGPVKSSSSLVTPTITYYTDYAAGQTIIINDFSSESDLKSVTAFTISFADFPAFSTYPAVFDFGTDAAKYGSDTAPIVAYVGAASRNNPVGTFSHSQAVGYEFRSYPLSFRMGLDNNEVGQLYAITNGIGKASIYYLDGGVSKLLDTYTAGTNSVLVNADVEKITLEAIDSTKHMLTKPGFYGNNNEDSDFPRVPSGVSTITITPADVSSSRVNFLDAAFIIKPTLPVRDFLQVNSLEVPKGTTKAQLVDFRLITTNGQIPAKSYYTQSISNLADPLIADVTVNSSNKNIVVLGKERGETTFTYTLTNRLGDEFKVDGVKVGVAYNYVPTTSISKRYVNGGVDLNNDRFNFSYWNIGDETGPIVEKIIVGVHAGNDTTPISALERGLKHYIREDTKLGYAIDGFKGTADGVDLVFTDEGNGVYSFTPPIGAMKVNVVANNKNATTDLTLRKSLSADAQILYPNQAFEIKVTEKGKTVPITTATLKSGETAAVSGLTFGRTYVVEETPVADLMLEAVTLEKTGAPVGTQPTSTSDVSYEFTLGIDHIGSEIVVYNQLAKGKGIQVDKLVTLDAGLPPEDFIFTLVRPNGDAYYGIVPKTTTVFPARVQWYEDAGHTIVADLSELGVGEYQLYEDAGVNYALDEFQVTAGTALPTSTPDQIIFEVTPTSDTIKIDAMNTTKKAGWVRINKIIDPLFVTDTMAFTLTHLSTGQEYIVEAQVTSTGFELSDWKQNGTSVPLSSLLFGEYSLTETLEGAHYVFDNFQPTAGVTFDPTGAIAYFTLSNTNPLLQITAENKLFEKGAITIKQVPDLDYGSHQVGDVADIVRRTSNALVEVESTLLITGSWRLTAQSDAQTAGGVTLPYQMLKYSKDGVTYNSLASSQVVLDETASKTGTVYSVSWPAAANTGIVADLRFIPGMITGFYTSTVTWALIVGP